jgi:AAA domain
MTFLSEELAEACARADAAASFDKFSSRKPWKEGLITAAALQTKQFKPVRIILPDLIPEGVTILAGKPKIGKSWLALDVCMAVADETRFVLGSIRPVHGDTLYLALEDNERRLHKRIDKIMQGQARWPGRLAMRTEWRRFDQGGLDDIEEWCGSVREPRLIWIDTLAKVRPVVARNEQAYAADYRAIEGVQRLAGKFQVGVVLTHHLRKAPSEDDPFDEVSGTLALSGAADTIVVMKRHAGMVKIYVRGRDIEEAELAAEFNRDTCRWRIVGNAEDTFRSQERQAITAALKVAAPDRMSIDDIMAATERRDRGAIKSLLHKMRGAGEVVSENGRYSLPPADPLNAVDRVDRGHSNGDLGDQCTDNASVSDADGGQRNGQRTANGQQSVDDPLTGTKAAKLVNANNNFNSGQRVNAVNGALSRAAPRQEFDPGEVPAACRRCTHCNGGGEVNAVALPDRPGTVWLHRRCEGAWLEAATEQSEQ